MRSPVALKSAIRNLSKQGLDITQTGGPWKQQKAQLDIIEGQIDALMTELEAAEELETRRKSLGFDPITAGSAATEQPLMLHAGGRSGVGGAPLDLTNGDAQRLFKSARGGESITVKAAPMTTGTTDPATTPHAILPPVGIRREPTRILDRLPVTASDAATNRYFVTTASGAGAGITAEGAQKPESDLAWTKQDITASKIAVWAEATEEALEDFPGFASFLFVDLRDQIIDAENSALLNSPGTAPSTYKGLLQVSGTLTYTRNTTNGETALDAIGIAFDSLRVGARYVVPDTIVLNPLDLGKIRRIKTTQGEYILGSPTTSGPAEIWGTPCVVTSKMPVGTVIVANLAQSCQVFLRSGISIRSNANGAGFRNNLVEFVAEERLSLAVTAPAAIDIVTIT